MVIGDWDIRSKFPGRGDRDWELILFLQKGHWNALRVVLSPPTLPLERREPVGSRPRLFANVTILHVIMSVSVVLNVNLLMIQESGSFRPFIS